MQRFMHYMRKHAGMITAVSGVVLMFAWVILPPLQQAFDMYSGSGGGPSTDTALTWNGGTVSNDELNLMRQTHGVAVRFLNGIVARTLEKGGQPEAPGLRRDPQTGQIIDPGIPSASSDYFLVQNMLLVAKAKQLGIKVNEESVKTFLHHLSAFTLQEGDWLEVAQVALPDSGMSVRQLFEQLETELLAQHMRTISQTALAAPSMDAFGINITPGEVWDYHNRLHRRLQIEALPVEVAAYTAQAGEPPPSELEEIFKKGKDRDPNPAMPDPAFHKPKKIAFEYFRIDFKPFLDEALKTIPENDPRIEEEYKKGVSQGKFKVLELGEDKSAPMTTPVDPAKPASDAKKVEGEKPAEAAKPDGAKPSDAKPDAERPADAKPADAPAAKAASDEEKKADEKKACEEQPAEAKQPEAKPSDEKAVEPKADARPADAKPDAAPPADKPATDKSKTETPAAVKPADAKAEPAKEVKFKPLSEVSEEIRKSLAQPLAEDARKAAVKAATEAVNEFGRKHRRWLTQKDRKGGATTATDPGKFNGEEIAKQHKLVSGSTPAISVYELQEYEIGTKAFQFDFQARDFRRLADIMFGERDPMTYQPISMLAEVEASYLIWATEVIPAADVKLEDVKPQVVDVWKRNKAFEIAKTEAQKLADKAASAKSLKDIATDPAKVLAPPAFSWFTSNSVAGGMGNVSLSGVDGIELAGREFMEAVFALKPGQSGVAPNQSHTMVYVVRVIGQEPTDDQLRERFLESGPTFDVMRIAVEDRQTITAQWYEDLQKQMNVQWKRPPRDDFR